MILDSNVSNAIERPCEEEENDDNKFPELQEIVDSGENQENEPTVGRNSANNEGLNNSTDSR